VAAGIRGLDGIVLGGFLADLHGLKQQLPMSVGAAAAALVERERRRDQLGPVFREPIGAVEGAGGLLAAAAGERRVGLDHLLVEGAERELIRAQRPHRRLLTARRRRQHNLEE
jgi:hypothetical protein